jgi:hypothetical protein
VLRRIFRPKRDEVTGEWRRLHSSPTIIRIIKSRTMSWVEHAARMGKKRSTYRLLVGKPEGKRPLGRTRCRWVGNVTMDLGEIGWAGVAQDRDEWRALVNAAKNCRAP